MEPLLTIDNLQVQFNLDEGVVRAVDGINLTIPRGTTVCLVGESGCGKSVAALSILRLVAPPGRIVSGKITLHQENGSVDLTALGDESEAIRRVRGEAISMIFQEPMTSLSPVHTIGNQIVEMIQLHTGLRKAAAKAQAIDIMGRVGIPEATRRFQQYPYEMSGGLRQRAMIAMALSCTPSLVIADEPTTALDVTIQAQILELMRTLLCELGMSILLITHDLGVVAEMAHQVAVMYLGRIVETGPVNAIFADPQHPYTRALLNSIPGRSPRKSALQAIPGSVPGPLQQIPGCPFHPRCAERVAGLCDVGACPQLFTVSPEHQTACFVRQREREAAETAKEVTG
ncbi:MAG TPA: ABC transporter ATP-binding protein [Armatimonadota bacterium]|nr:ABC transporter ATP-binding protein [Armatimonadota bacterium]